MPWIKNVTRFAPFSERMGVHVWIPYTKMIAEIFPTRLILGKEVIDFNLCGPISNFTVFAEWEKGRVQWYCKTREGHVRWYLYAKGKTLFLKFQDEIREFPLDEVEELVPVERLVFGCTKKQRIEDITRRGQLEEFLPLCFFLSQMAPRKNLPIQGGIGDLLQEARSCERQRLGKLLKDIFALGFYDLFVPTLEDRFHQKLVDTTVERGTSPLEFLSHLYPLIRNCFVQEGEVVHILPRLPVEIATGRFTNVQLKNMAFDLEWRKQKVERIQIKAKETGDVQFCFPKGSKSYRLRRNLREKGERRAVSLPLSLETSKLYYIDRFEN